MKMIEKLKTRRLALLLGLFILLLAFSARFPAARADVTSQTVSDPVTVVKHVNLGFTASQPISGSDNGCLGIGNCFGISWSASFDGKASVFADIKADVAMSYDPSSLVPGATIPIQLTYTPASNSFVSVNVNGIGTLDFTGCINCAPHTIKVGAGSKTFTAPLDSASSVTISGTSSTINISILGLSDVAGVDLDVSSSLTLSPTPPGSLPGLGGAAAGIQVKGATLNSLIPILEWDSAGATQTIMVTLPSNLSGGMNVTLQPLLHWLGTSATVNLELTGTGFLGDCFLCLHFSKTISLFSGNLGPVYSSIKPLGLDIQIGAAVTASCMASGGSNCVAIGNAVAAQVAAGNLPIPLLSPELSTIPPIPKSLGSAIFTIPGVSIGGAPTEGVLAGSTVSLRAVVGGGTPPFSFSWTRNGLSFPAGQILTDSALLGTTTYAVTVTDSTGAVSNTNSVTVHSYDFTISLTPASETVPQGAPATYTISIVLNAGSSLIGLPSSVSTSLLGFPSGASSPNFPASLPLGTNANSAAFNVTTSRSTPTGNYTLTAKGSTDTGSRSGTAVLQVITPQQATQNLINLIGSMGLPMGTTTSLQAPLGELIAMINAANQNSACDKLDAFISTVNTYLAQGKLTSAQASQLLRQANLIEDSLGC